MPNDPPVPYNLKPKATKLAEGPDATLVPTFPPTDPAARGVAPTDWPAASTAKGSDGPPDAPLAPPGVDPAARSVPAFVWAREPVGAVFNRAMRETVSPVAALDPDIAMWPVTPVQRWPFAGSPAEGIWPKGWIGVDNTATLWVCTVAGEPGTWMVLAGSGGTGWPSVDGSGPGNLQAETPVDDTVGYNFTDQGTGGFSVTTTQSPIVLDAGDPGGTIGISTAQGDVTVSSGGSLLAAASAGTTVEDSSTNGILLKVTGTAAPFTIQGTDNVTGNTITLETNADGQIVISTFDGQIALASTGGPIDIGTAGTLTLQGGTVVPVGVPAGRVHFGSQSVAPGGGALATPTTDYVKGAMTVVGNNLVVPVGGVYKVTGGLAWPINANAGEYGGGLIHNGTPTSGAAECSIPFGVNGPAEAFVVCFADEIELSATDTLGLNAFQDLGGPATSDGGWLTVSLVTQ